MATILSGRYGALVKRLFSLKEAPPAESLDSVFPSIELIDPADPLYSFDRGERRYFGSFLQAAVAAQNSFIRLANINNGMIMVVDELIIGPAPAAGEPYGLFLEQVAAQPGIAVGFIQPADTRAVNGVGHLTDLWAGSRAVPKASKYQIVTDAQGMYREAAPRVVLAPGWAWDIEAVTQNHALQVTFVYRVLELEPSMAT